MWSQLGAFLGVLCFWVGLISLVFTVGAIVLAVILLPARDWLKGRLLIRRLEASLDHVLTWDPERPGTREA